MPQNMPQPTLAPLLLLSGSGDSHVGWMRQLADLPPDSVITIDLPGHGDHIQDAAALPTTIAEFAAIVWADLDAQGIQRVRIAGHSLGGAIALRMALDRPERVVALGLIGTGARLHVLPELLATATSDPNSALEQLIRAGYAAHLSPEALRMTVATMLPIAPATLSRDLNACDSFDVMAELPRIQCPTLVIVGADDRLTPPKYARYLAEHIPHARLMIIPGSGHYVMHEQPERLTAALREVQQLG